MNSEVNQLSLICTGCLSSDRKLTKLYKGTPMEIFFQLVHSIETLYKSVQLCWECIAHVRKLLNFRNQVQIAQNHLLKASFHKTTLSKLKISKTRMDNVSEITEELSGTPPTTLSTARLFGDSILDDVKHEINVGTSYNCEQNTTFLNFTQNCYISNQSSDEKFYNNRVYNRQYINRFDSNLSEAKTEQVEPLTFIKVEESDDPDSFTECIQGFYVGELPKQTDLDLKHMKDATLKVKYKTSIISNGTSDNKKMEDFNESDDEPLKKKETGKRTKKKQGDKVDRRKNPGPKREKQAGVVDNARVRKKLQQLNVENGLLNMVVLSWEEVEKERQRALQSDAFTRHEYRCYDCVLGFNHRFKLDNHMKKHELTNGSVVCSVCRVRCRDGHALAAHRRRHRVRWCCSGCGGKWSRATVAADHLAREHGAPQTQHACSQCSHIAPTLAKLRNHLKSHSERQKCDLCGKTFRDRTSLRTHLFIHKGEKEYGCPRCGKRFLFKKAMEVHLVTHEAPAHLYCHQCDMNFKNRMSYYQHMKYNLKHIDPDKLKYACQLCDKRFLKAVRLEEHKLAVHLKSTPILCSLPGCNFACSSRPVLRTHTRMVHRGGRACRNHVCDTCGKAYTTKKTLEGHIRSHTGERPFRCADCPSTFGYEAALYNHNKLVHLKPKSGRGRVHQKPPQLTNIQLTVPTTVLHTVPSTVLLTVPSSTCPAVISTAPASVASDWLHTTAQTTSSI